MNSKNTDTEKDFKKLRKKDPFLDRRSGEDRREVHSLDYFQEDNPDRRDPLERRNNIERRCDCIRISEWSSVCPEDTEEE